MRILHVCLAAFYIDNYSYQENLLPKYHKVNGHQVEIIASLQTFDKNGEAAYFGNESRYKNENGIWVNRINYINNWSIIKKLRIYKNYFSIIEQFKPDIIFLHGCQFSTVKPIIKYKMKNPNVKIFVDNHADFSNSATNWLSLEILHKKIWKRKAQLINQYTEKFYGVLPSRVDFLTDIYNIPKRKVELLLMGGDDELIEEVKNKTIRIYPQTSVPVDTDKFVIVTIGKIDEAKLEVLQLMEVIKSIEENIILIVYGSVSINLKERFNKNVDNFSVVYGGWLNNRDAYQAIYNSNLVIFPGRHSVYWEITAAIGKPMIVKYWKGTTHIKDKDNVLFLEDTSNKNIQKALLKVYNNQDMYIDMLKNAAEFAHHFKYSEIAKKSIKS